LYNVNIGYGRCDVAERMADACKRISFGHIYSDVAGNATTNAPAEKLAKLLTDMVPDGAAVLYATSGAEANDTALKVALAYWQAQGQTLRTKFISRQGSFHGCGGLSSSVTGNQAQHSYFNQRPSTIFLSRPERGGMAVDELVAELDARIQAVGHENVAAFIAEPIIGAGGVYDPPDRYFPAVQALLRKYGILTIADEIVTGFGRVGEWILGPRLGFDADIVTVSKGLTAGYWPMAATILTNNISDVLCDVQGSFPHGYTMSGHPVGCEVACLVHKILRHEKIFENVRAKSPVLRASLQDLIEDHPYIERLRGDGFLLAFELRDRKSGGVLAGNVGSDLVRLALNEHRLMLRGNPESLIIAPPLIMTDEESEWLVDVLKRVVDVANFHH
jgi:adenosylmethionine-8-amino-7-oxononanoate aminotransferase